jgi:hypothetical protein
MKIKFNIPEGCIIVDTERCQQEVSPPKKIPSDIVVAVSEVNRKLLPGRPGLAYNFSGQTIISLLRRDEEEMIEVEEFWGCAEDFSCTSVFRVEGAEKFFRPKGLSYKSGSQEIWVTGESKDPTKVSVEEGCRIALLFPETKFFLLYDFGEGEEKDEVGVLDFLTNTPNFGRELASFFGMMPAWVAKIAQAWSMGN